MEKLLIKCKIVTPLLMHGADGKTPELRAQSFKGVMRFWWRAIHGNLSLDELKEREAEIFGDTKRKSSFRIRIVSSLDKKNDTDNYKLLDYKREIEKELENRGINGQRRKEVLKKYEKTTANGFKPSRIFEMEFLGRNLESVKNIFLLSTILGGFGQRARRGFGSIEVIEINGKEYSLEYAKNNIIELIKKINDDFSFNDENFESKRKYPYVKSIEIGKEYDNYESLMKQIGIATHKYSCFGSASPRQASPIVISILKFRNSYRPSLTTLNGRGCWKNLQDFKGMIL